MVGEGPRLRLRLSPVALDAEAPSPARSTSPASSTGRWTGSRYVELELETGRPLDGRRDVDAARCVLRLVPRQGAQAEQAKTRVANGRVVGTIKASHTDDAGGRRLRRGRSRSTRRSRREGGATAAAGGRRRGRDRRTRPASKAMAGKTEAAIAVVVLHARRRMARPSRHLDVLRAATAFWDHVRTAPSRRSTTRPRRSRADARRARGEALTVATEARATRAARASRRASRIGRGGSSSGGRSVTWGFASAQSEQIYN